MPRYPLNFEVIPCSGNSGMRIYPATNEMKKKLNLSRIEIDFHTKNPFKYTIEVYEEDEESHSEFIDGLISKFEKLMEDDEYFTYNQEQGKYQFSSQAYQIDDAEHKRILKNFVKAVESMEGTSKSTISDLLTSMLQNYAPHVAAAATTSDSHHDSYDDNDWGEAPSLSRS